MGRKHAPTHKGVNAHYSGCMKEEIYFADAELPFHVWVRERRGEEGYRWVLRETRGAGEWEAANEPAASPEESGE